MAVPRRSARIAAIKKMQLVTVTKKYRCTRVGTKNVYKMTDKITHRRGGITKKTLLITATPIKNLIGPSPKRREEKVAPQNLPRDVVGVTKTYRASNMGVHNIYSFTDKITRYRDGTTRKTTLIKSTPIENLIGPGPEIQ